MDISIYKNKSANEVVDKSITAKISTMSVRLKENCSRENPVFLLDGVQDIGDTADWNYLRVFKWNRYYYITDIITVGALVELHCHVDVLMSFKSDIKASTQVVSRQENNVNPYIVDGRLPIHSDTSVVAKNFGKKINPNSGFYVVQIAEG